MVSPILNENFYTGAFLVSQAPGELSFDKGVISNAGTADLLQQGGLVLSHSPGTPVASAGVANHGNATVGSIAAGLGVQIGDYQLIATAATTFDVFDPLGVSLGVATAGAAFATPEIGFLITAGGIACVAGDTYTIQVPPGGYQSFTGAAGLPAVAVLYNLEWIPAAGSKTVAVVRRNAEVNAAEIQWDPSIVNNGTVIPAVKAAALASLATFNILAR